MLEITPVNGPSVTVGYRTGENTVRESNPRKQTSLLSVTGHPGAPSLTFALHGHFRGWLSTFEPLAALNPVQLTNRAGVVQVTSQKPCQFCRFSWRHIPFSLEYTGYQPLLADSEETGVFTVEASMRGVEETTTLTLYRGDWLRLPTGEIVNFDTALEGTAS